MPSSFRSLRLLPALLVLVLGAILLRGYVTDDTYIHLRYARHVLELGEFSFNPGEATYGASSPLWIMGLVALLKAGLAPLAAIRGLGLFSAALTLLIAWRLIERMRLPAGWPTTLLLLIAADAWFLRWGMSGMETPLAGALLLALLRPAVAWHEPSEGARPWLAWGAAAGLATLTRPEFLLLAVAAAPWLLWAHRRRFAHGTVAAAVAMAAGLALVLGPWLAYASHAFGRLTPETAAAKSFAPTIAPGALLASLVRIAGQLGTVQGMLWVALLVVAVLALTVRGRGASAPAGRRFADDVGHVALIGIPVTWALLLAGGYAVKQVWVISRYVSPLLPALLLAAARLAVMMRERLATAGGRRLRAADLVLAAAVAATIGWNLWFTAGPVRDHARDFSRGVQECFIGTGNWLRANTPAGTVVAALDIGALGWASERRILDLAGLVSPEILELGREMGFERMVADGVWLEAARPDYVYDRTAGAPRWDGRRWHGVRFDLIDSCVVAGIGLREPQPWTYALYEVTPDPGDPAPADGD